MLKYIYIYTKRNRSRGGGSLRLNSIKKPPDIKSCELCHQIFYVYLHTEQER